MRMANEKVSNFKKVSEKQNFTSRFFTRARLRRRVLGAEYFCRVLLSDSSRRDKLDGTYIIAVHIK